MKCNYCDKDAKWINPHNGMHLCDDHAKEKLNQLNEEFEVKDTLKDWFLSIYEDDDVLRDGVWDLKNHKVIQN